MAYENLKPLPLEVIKQIQDQSVKMLYKLDEICKKHDIQYWAAYGTMLGAIRHKGFIPWDDDLDVCMMREDFHKLCNVPAEEWGDEFIFCSPESDEEFHDRPFGRVYIRNSNIQCYRDVYSWRRWSDGRPWNTKLILDIFVFDRIPDSDAEFDKIHKKLFPMLDKTYKLVKLKPETNKTDVLSQTKKVIKQAYSGMMRAVYKRPWVHINQIVEKTVASHQQGSRIATYCTTDFNKYLYDDVFPLTEAPFEDINVPIPKNWEQMLKDMYGDYMAFPPESERGHLDLVYCDLGNGTVFIVDPIKGSLGEGKEKNVNI